MPGVSREQIDRAKQVNLFSYIQQTKPQELIKRGHEYCLRSHDSLKVNPSSGLWNWHSHNIGGRTALDYLIHVEGIPFVEAVLRLCNEPVQQEPKTPLLAEKRSFSLPAANSNNYEVESYLLGRGITLSVIHECFRQGVLYESAYYHNAVFVGRDAAGIPRHAALRGTDPGSAYKNDAKGSDKRYSFSFHSKSDVLLAFEGVTDLLSYITMTNESEAASRYRGNHYLSLAGLAPIALRQYLLDHPGIRHIALCFDADEPGRLAAEFIKKEFRDRYTVLYRPPALSKDYNDMLLARQHEPINMERGDSYDR
jgi:hypothetical protein